jgi:hypothetical protein
MDRLNDIGLETVPSLPEFYKELQQTRDELNRFPDDLRWGVRAEWRPGLGIAAASATIIFTPLP